MKLCMIGLKITLLLVIAVMMSACSANYKSIYRHKAVTDSSSITSFDSKQRAVISTTRDDVRHFCSEPSPDVFSVIAQALSAGGVFGKSAKPASIEAAFRTQTINMLRELMFRTCERHLNGAYTSLEMSVQAIRDQRLMVSILAIEQITGAVTPRPVIIGAIGSSSAGSGGSAIVRLDDALKAKKAAEESHNRAEKAFNEMNGEEGECDTISETVEKDEALTEEQKTKQPNCNEARTTLASAKKVLSENTDHYSDLKRLASVSGVAASAYVRSSTSGGLDRAHAGTIVDVAGSVKEIVQLNFDRDTEVTIFCFKALTGSELDKIEESARISLHNSCLGYLQERVNLEQQRVLLEEQRVEEEIQDSRERMATESRRQFERQWPKLEPLLSGNDKIKFIDALRRKLIVPLKSKADCFMKAESKEGYFLCFDDLPFSLRRSLSEIK